MNIYPASIHAKKAHVVAYRDELRSAGRDHLVIAIPKGSAAYEMGYRFGTCSRDELADYIAGGAKIVDDEGVAKMTLPLYDKAMADFKKMFAPECNCRVTLDDKHVCACHEKLSGTKFPADPYGCENPVSGDEE